MENTQSAVQRVINSMWNRAAQDAPKTIETPKLNIPYLPDPTTAPPVPAQDTLGVVQRAPQATTKKPRSGPIRYGSVTPQSRFNGWIVKSETTAKGKNRRVIVDCVCGRSSGVVRDLYEVVTGRSKRCNKCAIDSLRGEVRKKRASSNSPIENPKLLATSPAFSETFGKSTPPAPSQGFTPPSAPAVPAPPPAAPRFSDLTGGKGNIPNDKQEMLVYLARLEDRIVRRITAEVCDIIREHKRLLSV